MHESLVISKTNWQVWHLDHLLVGLLHHEMVHIKVNLRLWVDGLPGLDDAYQLLSYEMVIGLISILQRSNVVIDIFYFLNVLCLLNP